MKRSNVFTAAAIATITAFITTIFAIFFYAPVDKDQGMIQKIFYIHVPAAWVGFLAFGVVFVCSIIYLKTQKQEWYIRARVSAELGVVFTTIVLITGPIWARPQWGVWWNWADVKLDSALLLWLLYLGYIMIGSAVEEPDKRSRFQSVYGIVAFIDVPIVFFSIRWWQTIGSSHPTVFKSTNLTESLPVEMVTTLLISLGAFSLLYGLIMMLRTEIERSSEDIAALKENRGE